MGAFERAIIGFNSTNCLFAYENIAVLSKVTFDRFILDSNVTVELTLVNV